MNMKWHPSALLSNFSLKSVLLDIRIATLACFLCLFDWKIFSQPFILRWYLSLKLICVSCMQQKDRFCFCIQSVSLCLFIGDLSLLMLMDINDQWLLVPHIFVFVVVGIVCEFPFFGNCWCGIIYFLCFCACS